MKLDPSYKDYLSQLEQRNGLPAGLLATQAMQESNGDPSAKSPKGALGMFQFMPDTAKQYGIDPSDKYQAAQGAAQMNADLLKKYDGDLPSALAAYNWGEGNVDRKGLAKAPEETRNYVDNIVSKLPGQSALSTIGNFIMPSAQAAEADIPPGFVPEQQAQSPQASPQSQPDYSPGAVQQAPLDEDVPPGFVPDDGSLTKNSALDSVLTDPLASATAYGANFMSQIPGAKETGSALAALAGAGGGGSFGSRYANLEDAQKAMREAGQTANPNLSILADASGLTAGLGLGGKLLGAAIPETSGLAAIAKAHPYLAGMLGNGAVGALYGFGDGEDKADRTSNAIIGGLVGGAIGLPLSVASSKLLSPALSKLASNSGNAVAQSADSSLTPDAIATAKSSLPATAADMQGLANTSYKQAEDLGGQIAPQGTNKFVSEAEKIMPQTAAGKIVAGETDATKLVARLQTLKDKPLSLAEAQEIDEALGEAIDSNSVLGKVNKQGLKLAKIQGALRDVMHSPSEGDLAGSGAGFDALRQGQAYWSQMMKMRDLERIQTNATLTDNTATSIRSGVRAILRSPARAKYYAPQEISSLKKAASTGILGEALRGVGSRLTQYAAGGAGFAAGGPVSGLVAGAAAHAVSGTARNLAEKLQTSRLQGAIDTIAKNTKPKVRK